MSCVCHSFASVLCCLVVTCWEGLTSWSLFVMFYCVCVTFPCGILGQVWYLIVSIPDLCRVSYFECHHVIKFWLGVCISLTSKFYLSQNDMCFYFFKQSFSYITFLLLLTVIQISALKFFILYHIFGLCIYFNPQFLSFEWYAHFSYQISPIQNLKNNSMVAITFNLFGTLF